MCLRLRVYLVMSGAAWWLVAGPCLHVIVAGRLQSVSSNALKARRSIAVAVGLRLRASRCGMAHAAMRYAVWMLVCGCVGVCESGWWMIFLFLVVFVACVLCRSLCVFVCISGMRLCGLCTRAHETTSHKPHEAEIAQPSQAPKLRCALRCRSYHDRQHQKFLILIC